MIYILHEVELFLGREKDGRFGGLIREMGKKRDSRRGAARFYGEEEARSGQTAFELLNSFRWSYLPETLDQYERPRAVIRFYDSTVALTKGIHPLCLPVRQISIRKGKDRKYYITAGDGKDDQHIVCKGHEKCITKLNELMKAFSKEVFEEE